MTRACHTGADVFTCLGHRRNNALAEEVGLRVFGSEGRARSSNWQIDLVEVLSLKGKMPAVFACKCSRSILCSCALGQP